MSGNPVPRRTLSVRRGAAALTGAALVLGLAAAVVVTDRRWVRILAPVVYAGSVVGLLLVLVMGSTINGSRSWLLIGGLSIQPAEFARAHPATASRTGDGDGGGEQTQERQSGGLVLSSYIGPLRMNASDQNAGEHQRWQQRGT